MTNDSDALMQGGTMTTDTEEQGRVSSEARENFQRPNAARSVDVNAIAAVFGEPFAPIAVGPTEQKVAKEKKKTKEKKSKAKEKKPKGTKSKHKEKKTRRSSSEERRAVEQESSKLHEVWGTETALQSSEMVSHVRPNSSRVNVDLPDPAASTLSAFLEEDDQLDVWSDDDELMHPSRHVATTARGRVSLMGDGKSGFDHGSVAVQRKGLESFADGNESVLTPFVYNERLLQDLGSEQEDDVSLELLVGYMMSMGADQDLAEQLAIRFAAEQGRAGRSVGHVTTGKAMEMKHLNHSNRWTGMEDPNRSSTSPLSFSQSSFRASPSEEKVVHATPVKEPDADWPIVYADTSPIGIKHLLQERTIRRLICIAVVFFLAGIVSLILYLTVFKTTETALVTNAPTMTPSQSPTFLSDDMVAAALLLSKAESLEDSSSPQFRAVSWMSTFDSVNTLSTFGLGSAFAQRYALVVIYFSLLGEGWTNQEKWLDPSLHECDWSSGIFCQYDLSEERVVTGFDATRNNLQGSVPDEIGLLTSSESFRIPKNTVGGTLPSTIGKMTSLSVIDCSENEIEGSIPSTIGGVSNLIQLDLSSNKLNSTIPNELYSLKLLRTLTVRSNYLSGPLNEAISALQSLVTLDVRNNSLSGPLPLSFDAFLSLDIVWLDYNQFSGMLPNITNSFIRKQVLSLSHNNFFGNAQLSPDFNFTSVLSGEDSRIQYIDISYNQLSGPISNTFFFLPNLKYFDLSGNSFTGTFQSNIGWLGIEHLAASNNALTGTIPIGYPTLSKCPVGLHASVLCARSDERFLCVQLIWT